jgi:hypothetical protein
MRGFDKKDKRAVSPVIATVMLVSLSLILAIIVFMWAKGFLQEQIEKNGQAAEASCAQLEFKASFIKESETPAGLSGTLQVVNRGALPIYGFDIKQIQGGDVVRKPFAFSISPGETLPGKSILLVGSPEDLEIYPILLGSAKNQKLNKQYTCLHSSERITIN